MPIAGVRLRRPNSTCTVFLEMLPLMGLLIVVTIDWWQFLSLFGLGGEAAKFTLHLKQPPLPWLYVTVILSLVMPLKFYRISKSSFAAAMPAQCPS